MNIQFYENFDSAEHVNKSIQAVGNSLDCAVYGECSIETPTLLLAYNPILVTCNYAYISEWGRYYYKTDLVTMSGNRCLLTLSVDPLMSFKDGIYGINCNVLRCEDYKISMIPDSNVMVYGSQIEIVSFNEAFVWSNSHSFVLTVLGGG